MVVSNHLPSRDVSDPSALRAAFDALPLSIVVLDAIGVTVVANRAWREFGQRNGLRLGRVIATADGKPTVAIGAHRDITERKQAEALLRASEQSLSRSQVRLRELASRLFRAHEDERRRLAREFHDDFSQRMAATSIQLGSLDKRFPDLPAEVRRELALVQEQVVELSDDLRRVSHELHPAALEQLGLESALRAHCARLTEHDPLELTFASEALHAELDRDVSVCLFRVAQEALRNVMRHSQARHAHVSLAGVTTASSFWSWTTVGGSISRPPDRGAPWDL